MYPPKRIRRKLDNAALAFPAAAGKKDSRVFRVYCSLNEPVQPRVLQKALEQVILKYPLFQCRLKRGYFWYYFEPSSIRPVIKKEKGVPCSAMYSPGRDNLLYQVTYNLDSIHLEVFHALTDGTGAFCFLADLVKAYLRLLHGIEGEETAGAGTQEEQEEDSFSRYYSPVRTAVQIRKSSRAYQMKGRKVAQADMKIMEYTVSVKQLLQQSRACQVSITVYLTAVLLQALSRKMTEVQKKKPVVVMIPVNLRNYYPSKSMTNFFGWMEIEYRFHKKDSFEDILLHVKKRFSEELLLEQVAFRMNHYVRIEKNLLLQYIPLGIKNFFIRLGTGLGSGNVSAVFSNMSAVRMPKPYEPYIRRFGVISSTDKLQMCACSYRDTFYFSITSKLEDVSVQEDILSFLRAEGFDISALHET
ncbi:alcohol acetyltransferase [Lactonifactor longoviformis]|uniref:Alcohol acetyltransferase n=1 Tax=Lactonifactor longoviformis DSM 17459 TaxID=1122155 RepID=A0A1M4T2X4_9CLOT|nr:hypothetical protein [Lactonifactor longoviformis]POP33666.1 alcohol acetyltransferase [Lactonifactor longoviformis]SHE38781.1 Alcohol acetyltransferase [Lactonifactor longoviformis DSM 17459]